MPDSNPPAPAGAAPALLRTAHVRRAHGVRGEVRVQSLGGNAGRFRTGTAFVTENSRRSLTVRTARALDGDELLLTFDEVSSREDAAALTGEYLCVAPASARVLGSDEWFFWQLVGLRARTPDGEDLGIVRDVESHPASEVLVVDRIGTEQRYPMVREWVREVDVASGYITLTPWPEDA